MYVLCSCARPIHIDCHFFTVHKARELFFFFLFYTDMHTFPPMATAKIPTRKPLCEILAIRDVYPTYHEKATKNGRYELMGLNDQHQHIEWPPTTTGLKYHTQKTAHKHNCRNSIQGRVVYQQPNWRRLFRHEREFTAARVISYVVWVRNRFAFMRRLGGESRNNKTWHSIA